MTKWLLGGAVLLLGGVLLYRRLLLPWHKGNAPTMAEQKRAAFSSLPKRYRVTQPAKVSRRRLHLRCRRVS